MTQNRRIVLNIVATYGRSLYALLLGLFTARWAMQALGQVDYGLLGVVGGMMAFVGFLNELMSGAVSRFYAVTVGQISLGVASKGLEDCRRWFTTAVVVHTILPGMLVLVGYPIGAWAIREFLSIPPDSVFACLWVWRFSCLSGFVSMVNVPFRAMYTAKQEIAELTFYSVIATTANAGFLYYIVGRPGKWLVTYAGWMCAIGLIPQLIICVRAAVAYPECRFRVMYACCVDRIRQLILFAGWHAFGRMADILREQGMAILINKYFGPKVNAASTVALSVSNHCSSLMASMTAAFSPAIMNAYGAGRLAQMRCLAYRVCKIGVLSLLVFAIPIFLEVDEVLHIWLGTPPKYTAGLCVFVLLTRIVEKTTVGHMIVVNAVGRIAAYQTVIGGVSLMTLPISWACVACGCNVYSIGWVMVGVMMLCAWGRLWFAHKLVGLSVLYWLLKVFLPLSVLAFASFGFGLIPRCLMSPSLLRICLTTGVVECVIVLLSWQFLLDEEERSYFLAKFRSIMGRRR